MFLGSLYDYQYLYVENINAFIKVNDSVSLDSYAHKRNAHTLSSL